MRITPGMSPNWASGPQNHPKPKVAVAVFLSMLIVVRSFLCSLSLPRDVRRMNIALRATFLQFIRILPQVNR